MDTLMSLSLCEYKIEGYLVMGMKSSIAWCDYCTHDGHQLHCPWHRVRTTWVSRYPYIYANGIDAVWPPLFEASTQQRGHVAICCYRLLIHNSSKMADALQPIQPIPRMTAEFLALPIRCEHTKTAISKKCNARWFHFPSVQLQNHTKPYWTDLESCTRLYT